LLEDWEVAVGEQDVAVVREVVVEVRARCQLDRGGRVVERGVAVL
jgi:hypothetical protein